MSGNGKYVWCNHCDNGGPSTSACFYHCRQIKSYIDDSVSLSESGKYRCSCCKTRVFLLSGYGNSAAMKISVEGEKGRRLSAIFDVIRFIELKATMVFKWLWWIIALIWYNSHLSPLTLYPVSHLLLGTGESRLPHICGYSSSYGPPNTISPHLISIWMDGNYNFPHFFPFQATEKANNFLNFPHLIIIIGSNK